MTGVESYQEQAEAILDEMPSMIDSKEYLATMLILDKDKHFEACGRAIEKELYILENTVNHLCNKQSSPQYKIDALTKTSSVINAFHTDGNYGHLWLSVIYNYGNLGHLYFEIGDIENALKYLKKSAELAGEYDDLPQKTKMTSHLFENTTYEKTTWGKPMRERMKIYMTERYPLSESFKETTEFKEIIALLDR